ncbi:hypothetical protein T4B_5653 [Trichinella pseudospiralis]|uniref:Uncharacterized protein n=1 Tax=Trichinella pseudospiralis TaxID=6337 RepID=A0A0V1ID94_TRIPS|nr:hypothetical protein T4A_7842 [Trichinella pseudospiralis]KRZ20790.1 hypothetical protein T4B_5653 [Trichinella pseudospiralis]
MHSYQYGPDSAAVGQDEQAKESIPYQVAHCYTTQVYTCFLQLKIEAGKSVRIYKKFSKENNEISMFRCDQLDGRKRSRSVIIIIRNDKYALLPYGILSRHYSISQEKL